MERRHPPTPVRYPQGGKPRSVFHLPGIGNSWRDLSPEITSAQRFVGLIDLLRLIQARQLTNHSISLGMAGALKLSVDLR